MSSIAYTDESATLYQGEAYATLLGLESSNVDAVIADPPYSSGGAFRSDRNLSTRAKYVSNDAQHDLADFAGDNRDQRAYLAWCTLWMSECLRVLKPGRAIAVFTDWRQLPTTTDALQAGGFIWRGIGIWGKSSGRPNLGISTGHAEYVVWGTKGPIDLGHEVYLPTIVNAPTPRGDERVHQTQKPLGYLEQLVTLAPPGGTVLDPFAGSGTTLVAARTTGRHAIGMELTDHYAAEAAKRLRQAPLVPHVEPAPEPETLSMLDTTPDTEPATA